MSAINKDPFRIRYVLIALSVAVLLGTFGFHFIERWSLIDSLYATVQTLTTVGYGDLTPADRMGRVFAIFVMLGGALGIVLAISPVFQSVVQELVSAHARRRLSNRMSKLHDHYVVCGAGRVGSHLIRDLATSNMSLVVIEKDPQCAAELSQRGVSVLLGDATREETLREVGVEHARGMASCLPDDADNIYAVLIARDLNPALHIVARAHEEQAESQLLRAGANHVIAPTIIGGHRMAVALTKPAVSEFIDSISASAVNLAFDQVEVNSASKLVGHQLGATPLCADLDVVLITVRRPSGEVVFKPGDDYTIGAGDVLVAVGRNDSLAMLNQMASGVT